MTTTTDETTHLRALLAEQTARADTLDQQLSAVLAGIKRNTKIMNGDNHLIAVAEAQQARAEKAEAACAELRAVLESVVSMVDVDATDGYIMAVDRARALLSSPDLGAGMVVVPREVVERVRDETLQSIATIMVFINDSPLIDRLRVVVADLDALLKKGGG